MKTIYAAEQDPKTHQWWVVCKEDGGTAYIRDCASQKQAEGLAADMQSRVQYLEDIVTGKVK